MQSRDVDAKMTQSLELYDKDFKAAVIKMLQQAFIETPET